MKKNELVQVIIEDIGVNGEGIGKIDGYTLFVKDAVIGDRIEAKITKAKKNYGYARLMKILEPSVNRVEAKCPVARQCGGCQIQELSYEKQLEFKEKKVRGNLERIGGFSSEMLQEVMEPVCGMEHPFYYRNKAQFPFGMDKEGNIITGFYAGRTHQIIPNTECSLGVKQNKEILDVVVDFMNTYHVTAYNEVTGKGLLRHVLIRYGFRTGEIMVCFVINGDKIPHSEKLVEKLMKIPEMTSITLNVNKERTNVILGREIKVLWGQSYITDYIGNVKYRISPLSFYQVNPVQMVKLYEKVLEYADLRGNETVLDIYCGVGTIGLFCADHMRKKAGHGQQGGKVIGIEAVREAVIDANRNAVINGIVNAVYICGKAEEELPKLNAEADVAILDPPRAGCRPELLQAVASAGVKRIVYVSCDPATMARDIRELAGLGYELSETAPVDMFPWTGRIEAVSCLKRAGGDASDAES